MKPTNPQPLCRVPGCKNETQIYSIQGTTAVWMKTCSLHTYLDLPEEESLETFWPPADKKDE
jgi:hypothetical protein